MKTETKLKQSAEDHPFWSAEVAMKTDEKTLPRPNKSSKLDVAFGVLGGAILWFIFAATVLLIVDEPTLGAGISLLIPVIGYFIVVPVLRIINSKWEKHLGTKIVLKIGLMFFLLIVGSIIAFAIESAISSGQENLGSKSEVSVTTSDLKTPQSGVDSGLSTEFQEWVKSQPPESLAKYSADVTAKVLPIQFDSMTTMFGVYSNQNVIVLRIQILRSKDQFIKELSEQGKTLADYEVDFKHMVTNLGCTQETPMAYIAHGVEYKYLVFDQEFKQLFESSVTDCP